MKNYLLKTMEDIAVGILESRACYVIFSKTQYKIWGSILQQKKQSFPFYRHFISNIFFKKSRGKKRLNNLVKLFVYNQLVKTCSNFEQ